MLRRCRSSQVDPFRTLSMSPFPGLPRVPRGGGNWAIRKRVDHPAPNEAAIANPAARAALHRLRNCENCTWSTPNDGRLVDSNLQLHGLFFSQTIGVPAE